jgi:hypothetical protein
MESVQRPESCQKRGTKRPSARPSALHRLAIKAEYERILKPQGEEPYSQKTGSAVLFSTAKLSAGD